MMLRNRHPWQVLLVVTTQCNTLTSVCYYHYFHTIVNTASVYIYGEQWHEKWGILYNKIDDVI